MMASSDQPDRRVERLAEAVRKKMLSPQIATCIATGEGEITIRIFRRGDGCDIKVTHTT